MNELLQASDGKENIPGLLAKRQALEGAIKEGLETPSLPEARQPEHLNIDAIFTEEERIENIKAQIKIIDEKLKKLEKKRH